jgi:hypothetical protein
MSEGGAAEGLCRSAPDPDLWFPAGFQTEEDKRQAREAAAVCGVCPVQLACLRAVLRRELGVSKAYRYGVWAGLTPSQRAGLQEELDRRRGVAA